TAVPGVGYRPLQGAIVLLWGTEVQIEPFANRETYLFAGVLRIGSRESDVVPFGGLLPPSQDINQMVHGRDDVVVFLLPGGLQREYPVAPKGLLVQSKDMEHGSIETHQLCDGTVIRISGDDHP